MILFLLFFLITIIHLFLFKLILCSLYEFRKLFLWIVKVVRGGKKVVCRAYLNFDYNGNRNRTKRVDIDSIILNRVAVEN